MRVWIFALALIVPGLGWAQDLPCGEVRSNELRLRFTQVRFGEALRFVAHIGRAPGVADRQVDLKEVTLGSDGVVIGLDGELPTDQAWYVRLTSFNPYGESPFSNELEFPALVSGPCTPLPAPDLLEGQRIYLEEQAQAARAMQAAAAQMEAAARKALAALP